MIAHHIQNYRSKGILVDTTLLLLLVVGSTPSIKGFKRIRTYEPADYQLLIQLIDQFDHLISTPHVLAEVCNLTNGLFGRHLSDFYATFKRMLPTIIEIQTPATEISERFSLNPYGLADVGIMAAAKDNYLVLTDDLRVSDFAAQHGVDVVNFNHVREAVWNG